MKLPSIFVGQILRFCYIGISFANVKLLSDRYGAEAYGIYAILMAWCYTAAVLSNLGVHNEILRSSLRGGVVSRRLFRRYGVAWLLYAFLAGGLGPVFYASVSAAIIIAYYALLSLMQVLVTSAKFSSQPLIVDFFNNGILPLALLITLLVADSSSVLDAVTFSAVVIFVLLVSSGLAFQKLSASVYQLYIAGYKNAREHGDPEGGLKNSSYFYITNIGSQLFNRIDILIIGGFFTELVVGQYAFMARISGACSSPLNFLVAKYQALIIESGSFAIAGLRSSQMQALSLMLVFSCVLLTDSFLLREGILSTLFGDLAVYVPFSLLFIAVISLRVLLFPFNTLVQFTLAIRGYSIMTVIVTLLTIVMMLYAGFVESLVVLVVSVALGGALPGVLSWAYVLSNYGNEKYDS